MKLECRYLPQNDGQCGWYETLPPPAPAHPLTADIRADWIVLGAGLAGLAAARRLAEFRPDESVALIDARRVGFGAAGRNSGFAIDLPHDLKSHSYTSDRTRDRQLIDLNRAAIDYLRQTVMRYAIDCDWREQGKIHAAVEPRAVASLEKFATGLEQLSEPFRRLDAAEMKRITGTDFYSAGLHTPGAVLLQPAALVRGLAATLPPNVTLYEDSPVRKIELGTPHQVSTDQGSIRAPRLILANNAYASQFSKLGLKGHILPVYTYASLTRPLTEREQAILGGESCWGLIPADPLGTTVRKLENGRLCIRNSFSYNPHLCASSARLKSVLATHRKSLARRFPMLPNLTFDYTWGGALCLSRNGGAPFGELAPNVFSAVCHNGLGLSRGTLAGKMIAEYALGIKSEMLDHVLEDAKPSGNPPEPFLSIGISSTLAWREYKAGRER